MLATENAEQTKALEVLLAALTVATGAKHTTPSGTPTTNYLHGPGGIFGVAGLEQDLISTRVHPQGLIGTLNALGTLTTNPLYAYLTGFAANTGTVADGPSQCFPVDEVVWATASLGAQRGGPGHRHGVRVPDCNQAADGALAVAHHDEAQALPEVVRRRSVETFRVHG